MPVSRYEVAESGGEWVVRHDGDVAGPYVTKEAAFDAAVATAGRAMAEGLAVELAVPGGAAGRWADDEG